MACDEGRSDPNGIECVNRLRRTCRVDTVSEKKKSDHRSSRWSLEIPALFRRSTGSQRGCGCLLRSGRRSFIPRPTFHAFQVDSFQQQRQFARISRRESLPGLTGPHYPLQIDGPVDSPTTCTEINPASAGPLQPCERRPIALTLHSGKETNPSRIRPAARCGSPCAYDLEN